MTTRGELIQEWRKRAGLNRAQVGRLVGTSRQNIDNLENDRAIKRRPTAVRLNCGLALWWREKSFADPLTFPETML